MEKIELVLIGATADIEIDASMICGSERFQLKAQFARATEAMSEIGLLSPQVILLDADTQSEDMVAVIRNLLMRSPGSALFCLSADWNEQRQYDCLSAGARGFLVRPLRCEDILQAMRKEDDAPQAANGEIFAFFSPKGKSGKTTLIANMALALARQTKESVAIVDADVQFGDLAVFFNLEPETTIVEAVRDVRHLSPVTLDPYFIKVNAQIRVLCGARRPQLAERVRAPDLEALLGLARSCYRYVLVDLPQGFNPISIAASEAADTVYLVTMVGGAYECRHLRRSLDIFRSMEDFSHRVKTIFTRVADCSEQSRKALAEEIGYPVTGMLPNAYLLVSAAANDGRMALDIKPESSLSRSITELINGITGEKGGVSA